MPAERVESKHGDVMGDRPSTSPEAYESRTPSPDLPGIEEDTCPLPAIAEKGKRSGLSVLGLGTPEVDRWIAAGKTDAENPKSRRREGKGKGRTVAFEGTERGDEPEQQAESEEVHGREQMLAVQVSPRRPVASVSAAAQWTSSPLRHLAIDPNKPSVSSAQDLLRTIVRDVMCDFRQETRAEMVGLHLDLVRMGRGWRRELRGLMEEYVGDLRDLREENKRLREENERLRSGR
jgi:protein NEDD1